MHLVVLAITVMLLVALAAVYVWIIKSSMRSLPGDTVQAVAGRVRTALIWGLLVIGAIVSYATLTPWPHTVASDEGPVVVSLTGAQWSWTVEPKEIPLGKPVVFAVTSTDVNHGAGIYDSQGRLLTQTQGMPGYINKVEYSFSEPGTYRILCLEYCGLAHHDMIDEIKVVRK